MKRFLPILSWLVLGLANYAWVRTEKAYGDFVLELEWKALKKEKYDSGVFIRAVSPPAGTSPWPERNQVNLRQDLMGNIAGL